MALVSHTDNRPVMLAELGPRIAALQAKIQDTWRHL